MQKVQTPAGFGAGALLSAAVATPTAAAAPEHPVGQKSQRWVCLESRQECEQAYRKAGSVEGARKLINTKRASGYGYTVDQGADGYYYGWKLSKSASGRQGPVYDCGRNGCVYRGDIRLQLHFHLSGRGTNLLEMTVQNKSVADGIAITPVAAARKIEDWVPQPIGGFVSEDRATVPVGATRNFTFTEGGAKASNWSSRRGVAAATTSSSALSPRAPAPR
ncbi:hypothetical protein KY5_8123c [Streptomyces formicae]|uniref:Secreted protein n=1 Tax=Streptomyces formicae TaxID=1616117 RepID=A0A291QN33_9ACTN|nr:hypothetical protein KY5_8123c [Streptomyces formicae]